MIVGVLFGCRAVAELFLGAIVSEVQITVSAKNTGGACDNAKKYIEGENLRDENSNVIEKSFDVHKAAVIDDTVGNLLKDTSGPSLNILIKLMAIFSLVFAGFFRLLNGKV
jgi:Na+/H+-translocating membrane pyrophosphatase